MLNLWLRHFGMIFLVENLHIVFSGNFQAADNGNILKKLCPKELRCLKTLMTDVLRPYIPEYRGDIIRDDESIL